MTFLKPNSHIHFIGIGGISMSALASLLQHNGVCVSGSDNNDSDMVKKLRSEGIAVDVPHQIGQIRNADLVVYTAAIAKDNCELVFAAEHGIPCWERPVLLGKIMANYPVSVGISGTHGKTTVTSMISHLLLRAETDPTLLVGGELREIDGNIRIGNSDIFVTEACEYVDSFLNFHPSVSLILNIEEDHLDYFSGIEQIKASFRQYASQTSGTVIANGADANVRSALEGIPFVSFGTGCDYEAADLVMGDRTTYTLLRKGEAVCEVVLSVPGIHNVNNSLAALAAADVLGLSLTDAAAALADFSGAKRRFEYKGTVGGVRVFDDYAHHPTEIAMALKAAQSQEKNALWCIFQPHTYTRTNALFDRFVEVLSEAEHMIVTDIYAAREKDTGLVHSSQLAAKVKNGIYLSGFDEIVAFLKEHTKPGDMVLTIGAGSVYRIGEQFLETE